MKNTTLSCPARAAAAATENTIGPSYDVTASQLPPVTRADAVTAPTNAEENVHETAQFWPTVTRAGLAVTLVTVGSVYNCDAAISHASRSPVARLNVTVVAAVARSRNATLVFVESVYFADARSIVAPVAETALKLSFASVSAKLSPAENTNPNVTYALTSNTPTAVAPYVATAATSDGAGLGVNDVVPSISRSTPSAAFTVTEKANGALGTTMLTETSFAPGPWVYTVSCNPFTVTPVTLAPRVSPSPPTSVSVAFTTEPMRGVTPERLAVTDDGNVYMLPLVSAAVHEYLFTDAPTTASISHECSASDVAVVSYCSTVFRFTSFTATVSCVLLAGFVQIFACAYTDDTSASSVVVIVTFSPTLTTSGLSFVETTFGHLNTRAAFTTNVYTTPGPNVTANRTVSTACATYITCTYVAPTVASAITTGSCVPLAAVTTTVPPLGIVALPSSGSVTPTDTSTASTYGEGKPEYGAPAPVGSSTSVSLGHTPIAGSNSSFVTARATTVTSNGAPTGGVATNSNSGFVAPLVATYVTAALFTFTTFDPVVLYETLSIRGATLVVHALGSANRTVFGFPVPILSPKIVPEKLVTSGTKPITLPAGREQSTAGSNSALFFFGSVTSSVIVALPSATYVSTTFVP